MLHFEIMDGDNILQQESAHANEHENNSDLFARNQQLMLDIDEERSKRHRSEGALEELSTSLCHIKDENFALTIQLSHTQEKVKQLALENVIAIENVSMMQLKLDRLTGFEGKQKEEIQALKAHIEDLTVEQLNQQQSLREASLNQWNTFTSGVERENQLKESVRRLQGSCSRLLKIVHSQNYTDEIFSPMLREALGMLSIVEKYEWSVELECLKQAMIKDSYQPEPLMPHSDNDCHDDLFESFQANVELFCDRSDEAFHACQARVNDIVGNYPSLLSKVSELLASLHNLSTSVLPKLEDKIIELKSQHDETRELLSKAETRELESQQSIKDMKATCALQREELESLHRKLTIATTTPSLTEKHFTTITSLENTNKLLEEKISSMIDVRASLEILRRDHFNLDMKACEWKDRLEFLEQEDRRKRSIIDELENHVRKLGNQHAEYDQVKKRADEGDVNYDFFMTIITSATTELRYCTSRYYQRDDSTIVRTLNMNQLRLKNVLKEIDVMTVTSCVDLCLQLEKLVDEAALIRRENLELINVNDDLSKENNRLKIYFIRERNRIVQSLEDRENQLRQDLKYMNDVLLKKDSLEARCRELDKQRRYLEESVASLTSELNEVTIKWHSEEKQRLVMAKRLDELSQECEKLRNQRGQLEKDLEESRQSKQSISRMLSPSAKKDLIRAIDDRIEAYQTIFIQWADKYDLLERQLQSSEDQLKFIKFELIRRLNQVRSSATTPRILAADEGHPLTNDNPEYPPTIADSIQDDHVGDSAETLHIVVDDSCAPSSDDDIQESITPDEVDDVNIGIPSSDNQSEDPEWKHAEATEDHHLIGHNDFHHLDEELAPHRHANARFFTFDSFSPHAKPVFSPENFLSPKSSTRSKFSRDSNLLSPWKESIKKLLKSSDFNESGSNTAYNSSEDGDNNVTLPAINTSSSKNDQMSDSHSSVEVANSVDIERLRAWRKRRDQFLLSRNLPAETPTPSSPGSRRNRIQSPIRRNRIIFNFQNVD